jgi:hypothetical protein
MSIIRDSVFPRCCEEFSLIATLILQVSSRITAASDPKNLDHLNPSSSLVSENQHKVLPLFFEKHPTFHKLVFFQFIQHDLPDFPLRFRFFLFP